MFVNDVQNALPLWHVERGRRFDPGHPKVILAGPAESWLPPSFCRPRMRAAGDCVAFTLPVHDDAVTL
jgi:hypothetical protein